MERCCKLLEDPWPTIDTNDASISWATMIINKIVRIRRRYIAIYRKVIERVIDAREKKYNQTQ